MKMLKKKETSQVSFGDIEHNRKPRMHAYLDRRHHIVTSTWRRLCDWIDPVPSETACIPITTSITRLIKNDVDTISSAAR